MNRERREIVREVDITFTPAQWASALVALQIMADEEALAAGTVSDTTAEAIDALQNARWTHAFNTEGGE